MGINLGSLHSILTEDLSIRSVGEIRPKGAGITAKASPHGNRVCFGLGKSQKSPGANSGECRARRTRGVLLLTRKTWCISFVGNNVGYY